MTRPTLSPPLHGESLETALLEMSETAVPQLAAEGQISCLGDRGEFQIY